MQRAVLRLAPGQGQGDASTTGLATDASGLLLGDETRQSAMTLRPRTGFQTDFWGPSNADTAPLFFWAWLCRVEPGAPMFAVSKLSFNA